ncbi:UDP-glucosyltransferase 2-like [Wyeomyia smithii]|uniref:UDP-glucosyltransferase 2-like n=1 Tax=Wyeomyia smithii TaxID=174621 RepID=UPI002467E2F6|nr:UDP-glucosyltransferase 2-like [Wyeomyia smithii]
MVPSVDRMKSCSFLLSIAVIVAATVLFPDEVESAKILCFFPSPSKSHVLGPQRLLKNLANRGHEVTMVSEFPLTKPVKNYRDIYVQAENEFAAIMAEVMQGGNQSMITMIPTAIKASLEYTNKSLNSPQFQQLIREERFDLVILGFFMNDFIVGVGPLLKCPTILYYSAGLSELVNVVGNPREIASVPQAHLGRKSSMTFFDRLMNVVLNLMETLFHTYIQYQSRIYYRNNFPSEKGFPSYEEAKLNVSLLMYNSHFTQTSPRPLLPNAIEVGGLQIKPEPDPLPEEIQAWLDGAEEHGAIFLSFGSNLKSSTLQQEKLEAIIGTLGKLKQRVIWKWDTDRMPGKPANVLVGKWLPQDDILAHTNLKLFITHGGQGSVTEAMYHGVPIVGIPIMADQDTNAAQVVRDGWGEVVPFDELTEAKLTAAVQRVLSDGKYSERVKQIATLFRDRPHSALDLATYWVEYVVRHKGAKHLHYLGADLNFMQRSLIDVAAFVAVALYVIYKLSRFTLGKIKKVVCGRIRRENKLKFN